MKKFNKNKTINKDYWEKNIQGFSEFYDKTSEENINGPRILRDMYKKYVFPVEKKFMSDRYRIVSEYIEKKVHQGMQVADIGCGNGIFSKKMASKGAKVYALDYVQSALDLTSKNLSSEEMKAIDTIKLDITAKPIPQVNLAISIGVLTYIDEVDQYFDNILPYTDNFLFNYLSATHPVNVMRKIIPVLDVRHYSYHKSEDIFKKLEERDHKVVSMEKLATGFVISTERRRT